MVLDVITQLSDINGGLLSGTGGSANSSSSNADTTTNNNKKEKDNDDTKYKNNGHTIIHRFQVENAIIKGLRLRRVQNINNSNKKKNEE